MIAIPSNPFLPMLLNKSTSTVSNRIHFDSANSISGFGQSQNLTSSLHSKLLKASSSNFGTLGSGADRFRGGSVGRNDSDLFKFKLNKKRKVSLDVTIRELISDRYIQGSILNSSKNSLKKTDKTRAPFGSDDISLKLQPGTYYVKIATDGKKIFYNFSLSVD
jgi:hypothetical protein